MRAKLVIGVAIWALVGTALPVRADSVRITSGSLSGSDSTVNDFAIFGQRFEMSGIIGSDAFGEPHWRCDPLPCPVGSMLSLSSRYSGGIEDIDAVVNGVFYSDVVTTLDFTASSITIPDLAIGERIRISQPFTFAGTAVGFRNGVMAFSHQLFGSGTVFLSLNRWDPELGVEGMNASLTRYEFEAEASPVPEPASMLLVGTGIAGVVAARRRRKVRNRIWRLVCES